MPASATNVDAEIEATESQTRLPLVPPTVPAELSRAWVRPVIVTRTPLRVSFVGGGSDLRSYYQHEPGAVVSTAIDKYVYITVNPKFDGKIRVSYSVNETVDTVSDVRNDLARESLKLLGIRSGVEVTSISDVPSQGTGLGSSSTYTVGLLNALHAYLGHHAEAERLASEACRVEIERCGRPIGKQDQYIAAYGGLQFIQFNPDGTVVVAPIICREVTRQRLRASFLMLYTGITRSAADVLSEQRDKTARDPASRAAVRCLTQLAHDLRACLERDDLDSFGEILHQGWSIKRTLASMVSTDAIDQWYERARAHGAIGGKILGAGGGGFLLLYAHPDRHADIASALSELRPVPVRLEPQGSKIVYADGTGERCNVFR